MGAQGTNEHNEKAPPLSTHTGHLTENIPGASALLKAPRFIRVLRVVACCTRVYFGFNLTAFFF